MPETAQSNDNGDDARTNDANVDTVLSWYEDRLPIGEPYEGLEFCETYEDELMASSN